MLKLIVDFKTNQIEAESFAEDRLQFTSDIISAFAGLYHLTKEKLKESGYTKETTQAFFTQLINDSMPVIYKDEDGD